jgi:nucleoside diphosphate kinase
LYYRCLEGTPQFRVTAEFMSSGPVVVAVLSKVDAVNAWRELIGPADPNVARDTSPGSLRAQLGVDALRNVVHGRGAIRTDCSYTGLRYE